MYNRFFTYHLIKIITKWATIQDLYFKKKSFYKGKIYEHPKLGAILSRYKAIYVARRSAN